MAAFRKTLGLLKKELSEQEKLLKHLTDERQAIIKLDREACHSINEKKKSIVLKARKLEAERVGLLKSVLGEPKGKEPLKFSNFLTHCPEQSLRLELTKASEELREKAQVVRLMNTHNGQLIRQSLGLLASAISVFRGCPGTELPTYGQRGKLKANGEDPAFGKQSRSLAREV